MRTLRNEREANASMSASTVLIDSDFGLPLNRRSEAVYEPAEPDFDLTPGFRWFALGLAVLVIALALAVIFGRRG